MELDFGTLTFFVIMMKYVLSSGQICLHQRALVPQNQITSDLVLEYVRNLTCSATETQMTFYKCKVACMKEQTCDAMRYASTCEMCSLTEEDSNMDFDLNHVYVNSEKLRFAELIGKNVNYMYSI